MYDSVEINLARKKVYGCFLFSFVGSMMKLFDSKKVRSKVKTGAYLLELAPAPISLSLSIKHEIGFSHPYGIIPTRF